MSEKKIITHLKLHLIVFIYGFTAILGKLIHLPAINLVWYRMLIAAIVLYLIFKIQRINTRLTRKEIITFLSVGFIVAAHWITFFGAVKLSNVSVTLGCLATTTLFTGLIDPLFNKRRLNAVEIVIGLVIIIGLYLIFQFETRYWKGILVALLSALLAGLFTVLNAKLVSRQRARIISFYEMLGGFIIISIYLFLTRGINTLLLLPSATDLLYLLILGIVCTAFAFVIQVDVMKNIPAYIVSLTINLEPVYGIVLAYFIFGSTEFMSTGFYIGTLIILLSVFGYPLYLRLKTRARFLNT